MGGCFGSAPESAAPPFRSAPSVMLDDGEIPKAASAQSVPMERASRLLAAMADMPLGGIGPRSQLRSCLAACELADVADLHGQHDPHRCPTLLHAGVETAADMNRRGSIGFRPVTASGHRADRVSPAWAAKANNVRRTRLTADAACASPL